MIEIATDRFVIPGTTVIPFSPIGRSVRMPWGLYGRMPQRTVEDAVRSLKKHIAEILDATGSTYLEGLNERGEPDSSDAWEVRLWDEEGTFQFPFARVSLVGPETVVGPALYADVTQAMTVHLYPYPAPDTERAILVAVRLRNLVVRALKFGSERGKAMLVPLWDYGSKPDLYVDSESRRPNDYFRVEGLTSEHMLDPEDPTQAVAIINLRAVWRIVPSGVPGHLIESVRMAAHPS